MKPDSAFSAISEGFAAFLSRLEERDVPQLALAAKLLCEAVSNGHVCLDLNNYNPNITFNSYIK